MTVRRDDAALGPVNRQGLAVLRHADRRTSWAIVLAAQLERPVSTAELDGAMALVHESVPIIGARLVRETWLAGTPAATVDGPADPLSWPDLTAPFQLGNEAPLRVVVGAGGQRLALAGHHAAFDGRSLIGVLAAALGAVPTDDSETGGALAGDESRGVVLRGGTSVNAQAREVTSIPRRPAIDAARGAVVLAHRLLRPADRVAASAVSGNGDTFVARDGWVAGTGVTQQLAAATADAAAAFNHERHLPWRRIGLSIGVGGHAPNTANTANTASFRRIDVDADEDISAAVAAALAAGVEPPELRNMPRYTRPLLRTVVKRLSDSLLISNLGGVDIPQATRVEFYPVARGRSAVAIGATGRIGGPVTVTLRARDVDGADAELLLENMMKRLAYAGLEPSSP